MRSSTASGHLSSFHDSHRLPLLLHTGSMLTDQPTHPLGNHPSDLQLSSMFFLPSCTTFMERSSHACASLLPNPLDVTKGLDKASNLEEVLILCFYLRGFLCACTLMKSLLEYTEFASPIPMSQQARQAHSHHLGTRSGYSGRHLPAPPRTKYTLPYQHHFLACLLDYWSHPLSRSFAAHRFFR